MDSRIELLLDKYWKCETSLEEEKELRDFFNSNEASEEWKETALFRYFESQKNESLNKTGFDERVKTQLDKPKGKVVNFTFRYVRIAAGVLVLIAAGYMVRHEIKKTYPDEIADTYTDPKVAFEETKRALMMISNSFNKAKQETSKIRVFNEAEQVIQNGTDPNQKEEADI